MNKKELTFQYFKNNPKAVEDKEDAKHYKALGIKQSTYNSYKLEYQSFLQAKEASILRLRDPEKYFIGRLREKFIFDDSKLFSK